LIFDSTQAQINNANVFLLGSWSRRNFSASQVGVGIDYLASTVNNGQVVFFIDVAVSGLYAVDISYPVASNPTTNATVRVVSATVGVADPTVTVDQSVSPPLVGGFLNIVPSIRFTNDTRHSVAVFSQSASLISNNVVYVDAVRIRYLDC
jgi:hypothetical protein